MRLGRLVSVIAIAIIGVFLLTACEPDKSAAQRDQDSQEDMMDRAHTEEPMYQIENFLSRRSINEWTKRMDTPDKLWYIYLMTDSGAFVGYHICDTVPLSYGVSLTNPQQYYSNGATLPAPGVDGVYYSGADPSVHYCFDAETGALITFNLRFVHYDMPLDLDVPRLRLEGEIPTSERQVHPDETMDEPEDN